MDSLKYSEFLPERKNILVQMLLILLTVMLEKSIIRETKTNIDEYVQEKNPFYLYLSVTCHKYDGKDHGDSLKH